MDLSASMNPYESLRVIVEDSPMLLVDAIRKIKTPIRVISIVQIGNKSAAYLLDEVATIRKPLKARQEK